MIDRNLNALAFGIRGLAQQFLDACKAANYSVIITETWRDPAREDQLHAQGITAATGASCKHCFTDMGLPASKAFDFAVLDENNRMVQDGTDERYAACGQIAKGLGLTWGGDFTHPDYDHVEME